ncbi:MAG TPA: N-formylglutamate amidohydrolase [Pseudomonadota bacterium]|nr:N-formylglutamate amidohydrolase [Pseudomonadota bacterium]HNF98243.1 N-formylglutamate amidohydrolase [Pseudomonadota bacterium]
MPVAQTAKIPLRHDVCDAYECLSGDADSPLLLTCEHASQRFPSGYALQARDNRLVDTHWAFDLGARELTHELASALSATAVLANFSRLLIDPNREEHHPDLLRTTADGEAILLNQNVTASDRLHRTVSYYRPYHEAVDAALARSNASVLLSIHTFTPIYEGQPRTVELGVLFDRDESQAESLLSSLRAVFPHVAANQPWSGKLGLIYSAESHAHRFGRTALELEVRQDRAQDPSYRQRLIAVLCDHFRHSSI